MKNDPVEPVSPKAESTAGSADNLDDEYQLPINPHPVMRYSIFRLGLFALALGLLWLVHVRGLLLVALAVLISGLASYALLQRERDAMSARVAASRTRRKSRAAQRAAREDDIADELAADELAADERAADEQAARGERVDHEVESR
jgi:hypothetical protein